MNKILVVHLKRFGDLIAAGQMIGSIKVQNPHTEVSLLCFEEFTSVTKLISGLKTTFSISRNALMTLKNGALYNNGFALDDLFQRLEPVRAQNWDRIINLTNDKASAHLCSWLSNQESATRVCGINIDQHGLAKASNSWAIAFNDILPRTSTNSPFNFRDVWSQMAGTVDVGATSLLTNPKNEETVQQHFNNLRQSGSKIVGIQVACSVKDKGFSQDVVAEISRQLHRSKLRPMLLIAPNELERAYVQEIIEQLDFKPVVIESDFTALSSVVKNLDLLITPDTVSKHFADAHNIACIEVSLGSSPVFKQATILEKSRLIVAQDRTKQVPAADIMNVLHAYMNGEDNYNISAQSVVYKPTQIGSAVSYQYIAGHANAKAEYDRHALTSLVTTTIRKSDHLVEAYAQLALDTGKHNAMFTAWATQTKELATDAMKDLLHSIRSLLQMRENPRKSGDFVNSLERLFSYCEEVNPATIGIHFFRARVESLPPANFAENARAIESLLFELKADLQNSLSLVNEWEKVWSAAKFSSRKNRIQGEVSP